MEVTPENLKNRGSKNPEKTYKNRGSKIFGKRDFKSLLSLASFWGQKMENANRTKHRRNDLRKRR